MSNLIIIFRYRARDGKSVACALVISSIDFEFAAHVLSNANR